MDARDTGHARPLSIVKAVGNQHIKYMLILKMHFNTIFLIIFYPYNGSLFRNSKRNLYNIYTYLPTYLNKNVVLIWYNMLMNLQYYPITKNSAYKNILTNVLF